MLAFNELRLVTDMFTALALCKKVVVRDVLVALRLVIDAFTAFADCKKAVVSDVLVALRLVTDKFAGIVPAPPSTPLTYNVPKLAFGA